MVGTGGVPGGPGSGAVVPAGGKSHTQHIILHIFSFLFYFALLLKLNLCKLQLVFMYCVIQ